MTNRIFTFIALIIFPVIAYSQQTTKDSGKVIVKHLTLGVDEDEVDLPPPPHLASKFKTLQDWLFNICDNDKPKKSIAEYRFGLSESPNDYTLFLAGVNTYEKGKSRSVIRIEFEPINQYFKLPEKYYKNLNRAQLIDKLTSQLKHFARTGKFKNSFFAKSNIVIFETNGQTIWSQ